MTTDPSVCWKHEVDADDVLSAFPEPARRSLRGVLGTRGVLEGPLIAELMAVLDVDLDQLMVELLLVARAYAIVPISHFSVGAVARGMPRADGSRRLYFGANFEVCGESPSFTVHAEQAATINAWQHGEPGIEALATSSPPCGYCRQFLYELSTAERLHVLVPTSGGHESTLLTELLPSPFGPQDLDNPLRLMEPSRHPLRLAEGAGDPLARVALRAAEESYAPYTEGFAGVALELGDGTIWPGRYAENAAHNPTLRPLIAAASFLTLNRPITEQPEVNRAALVARCSEAGELGAGTAVLGALAPHAELKCYAAKRT